jgi:hypothetical protein
MEFWKRENRDERQLRASLARPPDEFVQKLAGRIDYEHVSRPARGLRIAVAGGLTAAGLIVFGAFGGLSYAAKAVSSATGIPIVKTHQSGPKQPASNTPGSAASSVQARSPADDQYGGKTTICHRTGSKKNPWVVITVNNNSLPAHKAHGDTLVNPNPPPDCPGPPIP